MDSMNPRKDSPAASDCVRRHRATGWVESANGYVLSALAGLLVGVVLIPGDGNPGHIFCIGVIGLCGLLLQIRPGGRLRRSIIFCVLLIAFSWPISIALRDSTASLMPGLAAGHFILVWLRQLLPAALFFAGMTRWIQTRSWTSFVVAVIPLSVQLGYIVFRSPLTAEIDRIERNGIIVTGTATDGYAVFIVHDKTDSDIRAAFEDLKQLPCLKSAVVQSKSITDESICLLSKLSESESLQLDSMGISREGLKSVSQMPRLRRLCLVRVRCDDEDLAALDGSSSLQTLVISDCAFSNRAIGYIAKIKTLRVVSFVGTSVSARGIQELKAERPELEIR